MDKPTRAMNVHLGPDLKGRWVAFCASIGRSPGAAIREAIAAQLETVEKLPPKQYQKSRGETPAEPKERFEVVLTVSEKKALRERADVERCSMRRWVVDAIRAGLTREPQFGMREVEALGQSNYQLIAIGRNLNQIARRMNAGKLHTIELETVRELSEQIAAHTASVNDAIRASLERWNVE